MIRFFVLISIIPVLLISQTESSLLSYDVVASLNERTREVSGTVHVSLRLTDPSISDFSFMVPKEWTAVSIQDVNNETIDLERSPSENSAHHRIMFDRTDLETKSDTIAFFVSFTAVFDSLPTSAMFVAQKEFILPYERNIQWLPEIGNSAPHHVSLRFTAPLQFTLLPRLPADTTVNNGMRMWTIDGTELPLSSVFSICGAANVVRQFSLSSDSSCSVTFYSSPLKFNQQYAAATAQQLSDALQFFNAVTGRRINALTYMVVGSVSRDHSDIDTALLIIRSNEPAFTVFDSAAITRSVYNPWITELARRYCPPTVDSTALFDDGLAAYLASRFLMDRYPEIVRQERFDAVSNALTFFPSGTLAEGHSNRSNTNSIISYRGRYLFFMVEYLIGQESLDRVLRQIVAAPADQATSFDRFTALCSAEYGTPLDGIIDQWLRRSASPEYVMQWRSEKTVRGLSVVKATVEQRGTLFSMPIPLTFTFGNRVLNRRVRVEQQKQEFTFTFPSPPSTVELDPERTILRWLLELRIPAHAKTALLYLTVNRDIAGAEREALYTQQLDPNNSTGSAPLVLFILGNISAQNGNKEMAKEYFLRSASAGAVEETEVYRLLSLIRFGHLLEMEGKRDEAVAYYQRVIADGMKDPVIHSSAVQAAERSLRERFSAGNDHWFTLP